MKRYVSPGHLNAHNANAQRVITASHLRIPRRHLVDGNVTKRSKKTLRHRRKQQRNWVNILNIKKRNHKNGNLQEILLKSQRRHRFEAQTPGLLALCLAWGARLALYDALRFYSTD